MVTDASGNVVGENRYYPYGETHFTTGTMYTDKLYTGQREMAGLGIYHYNARFYSPKLGRFLSADSIVPNPANPQDLNRFSYVRNNPLRYVDPTGHVCTDPEDPNPTCYGSSSVQTRVGNIMVRGNETELRASRLSRATPATIRTVTTTTNPTPTPSATPPTVTPTYPPTPTDAPTPTYSPTSIYTSTPTPTLPPTATITLTLTVTLTPAITPTFPYNPYYNPYQGPPGCRTNSECWAEAASALDPPGGGGGLPGLTK